MKTNFKGENPILIVGPTASGKSDLAIKLANKYNGVIINADALQVYKQWKILTASPNHLEKSQCPHWLYGHIDIGMPYSSGQWLKDIKKALERDNFMTPEVAKDFGLIDEVVANRS